MSVGNASSVAVSSVSANVSVSVSVSASVSMSMSMSVSVNVSVCVNARKRVNGGNDWYVDADESAVGVNRVNVGREPFVSSVCMSVNEHVGAGNSVVLLLLHTAASMARTIRGRRATRRTGFYLRDRAGTSPR
eukprot:GEMP01057092.1.p3 GENE.GEMP01057092.1~~GEMP01057092.1.p3  ORF type:complete len:133 (+),score=35.48 GEMP01057092.1:951-1349(+)